MGGSGVAVPLALSGESADGTAYTGSGAVEPAQKILVVLVVNRIADLAQTLTRLANLEGASLQERLDTRAFLLRGHGISFFGDLHYTKTI